MKEYKIPLQFKSGKFHFSELMANNEDILLFSCEKFDILSYFVPIELFDMAIDVMTNIIKNNVIDKLDKADDFKFIAEEYD